jgi:hypothetical protein
MVIFLLFTSAIAKLLGPKLMAAVEGANKYQV